MDYFDNLTFVLILLQSYSKSSFLLLLLHLYAIKYPEVLESHYTHYHKELNARKILQFTTNEYS